MSDYSFDEWLRGKRREQGWTGPELAAKSGVSKQVINAIERQSPHPITGAPYRPRVETVDKLANALGGPLAEARESAGFAAPADATQTADELELKRLTNHFKELPRECQLDVLATLEALWRRRRTQGRAERMGGKKSGKRATKVDYPSEGRPARKRRTG